MKKTLIAATFFGITPGLLLAQNLSGTAEGMGGSKLTACKEAKRKAGSEAQLAINLKGRRESVEPVQVRLGECICDEGVAIHKCLVDYQVLIK